MSIVNLAGEEITLPQDAEAFRHRLENSWAADKPHRWKQLAVLTLVGNGWEVPNIARALGLHRGHVYRILNHARNRIAEFMDAEPDPETGTAQEPPCTSRPPLANPTIRPESN